jgi:hypothetical protein
MWSLRSFKDRDANFGGVEPYFEDEAMAEVGLSLTNYILNGSLIPINNFGWGHPRAGRPLVGYHLEPWPSHHDMSLTLYQEAPFREVTESMLHYDIYPVPVMFFERLQQDDFWNYHIGVFGISTIEAGLLIQGRRFVDGTSFEELDVSVNVQQIPIPSNASIEDRAALSIENRKRTQAEALSHCLITTIHAEASQKKKQASIAGTLLAGVEGIEYDHNNSAPGLPTDDDYISNEKVLSPLLYQKDSK